MVAAIIVAAGKGIRMRDQMRKQYLALAGRPIIVHTLTVFGQCHRIDHIYLVIPSDDFEFCRRNILGQANLAQKVSLIAGGVRRQDSVYNGLQQVDPNCRVVVIHDGVRPLVQPDHLSACIDGAEKSGACILGIPVHDTLKRIDQAGNVVHTIKRDTVWLAQTPQAFRFDLIKKAHERAISEGYQGTDDASLVERMGSEVSIFQGSRRNIKITHQEDLKFALALLENTDSQHTEC